jgi:hypothetical protein
MIHRHTRTDEWLSFVTHLVVGPAIWLSILWYHWPVLMTMGRHSLP